MSVIKDIKGISRSIDKQAKKQNDMLKQISEFIDTHAAIKKLSKILNANKTTK